MARPPFTWKRLQDALDRWVVDTNGRHGDGQIHEFTDPQPVWRKTYKYETEVLEEALRAYRDLRPRMKIPRGDAIRAFNLFTARRDGGYRMRMLRLFSEAMGDRQILSAGIAAHLFRKVLQDPALPFTAVVRSCIHHSPDTLMPSALWKGLLKHYKSRARGVCPADPLSPNGLHYISMNEDSRSEWWAMVRLVEAVRDGTEKKQAAA